MVLRAKRDLFHPQLLRAGGYTLEVLVSLLKNQIPSLVPSSATTYYARVCVVGEQNRRRTVK
jgi:hypothetical protein